MTEHLRSVRHWAWSNLGYRPTRGDWQADWRGVSDQRRACVAWTDHKHPSAQTPAWTRPNFSWLTRLHPQRSPLGGRGFESYSEDPLLSGKLAASIIRGCQSKGVSATPKHYVCNDQELDRNSNSSEVSLRALREIYLKPFQIAIRESDPWALMTA